MPLEEGSDPPPPDASVRVVWDPQAKWTLQSKELQSASDYCPYEGTSLLGRAEKVYLRGELAAENGEIIKEYQGQYVRACERVSENSFLPSARGGLG